MKDFNLFKVIRKDVSNHNTSFCGSCKEKHLIDGNHVGGNCPKNGG